MAKNTRNALECAHCGQPAPDPVPGNKPTQVYCCFGCKVVHEMLGESSASIPYETLPLEKYAYLDEAKIQTSLLDFQEENYARITLRLPQIHCSSCIYLLENLSEIEDGIQQVQVNFAKKQASIAFRTDKLKLSMLAALLEYIHYPPDFQSRTFTKGKSKRNKLILQLGTAGFFFGNTMLLAIPDYLGGSLALHPELQHFFRLLMFGFSLPVLLYSAQDYYLNALKSLRAGFLSIDLPIALGATVLFLRSSYEVFSGLGNGYFDSLTGLIFFLLVGKWYQEKTYANFSFDRDFRSFMPLAAHLLLPKGKEKALPIDDLEKDDRIKVYHGEVLPTDGYLQSEHAALDYSYITGESLPVAKHKNDLLYAGGKVQGNPITLVVSQKPNRSYLASLWKNQAFNESGAALEKRFSDSVSQYFTPIIIVLALVAGGFWIGHDLGKAAQVFTAVLIVACPCALALAEPFANGSLMRWYGRYGLFLKSSAVVSRLYAISQVVFDKTGTLTQAQDISVTWQGAALSSREKQMLSGLLQSSQHPLAQAVLQHFTGTTVPLPVHDFNETIGKGIQGYFNTTAVAFGSGSWLGAPPQVQPATRSYLSVNGTLRGYFEFSQKPRPALPQLMLKLKEKYRLALLSGDTYQSESQFKKVMGRDADLVYEAKPQDKLCYVQKLQQQGHKVMMIGDGLNDAGALKQSDVGISLCEKNVNYFPASHALMMAEALPRLASFLKLSKLNRRVITTAFIISFLYNIVGISFAAAGLLSPLVAAILMPVSSVTIVIYTTLANAWLCRRHLN